MHITPTLGLAAATVLAAVATSCSAPAPAERDATDAPSLDATVRLGRVAASRGMVEIGLSPADGEAVEITSLQLRDPRFTVVPATPRSTLVDRRLNIPVDIGDAVCDDLPSAPPHAVIGRPEAEPLVVPVDADGEESLATVHRTACNRQAVTAAVDLRFGPRWEPVDRATARGVLTLDRAGSEKEITLAGVQGTVIFTLEAIRPGRGDVAELGRLEPDDDHVEVPVEVTAARCDPHAFIESKRTYLFSAWVGLGDDEPVFVTVEPQGAARSALERLLVRGCGIERPQT